MEKNKYPVDEFFRESLTNHTITPSREAKAEFLREATALVSSRKSSKRWIIYLSGIIILIGTGIGTWFIFQSPSMTIVKDNKNLGSPKSIASAKEEIKTNRSTFNKPTFTTNTNLLNNRNIPEQDRSEKTVGSSRVKQKTGVDPDRYNPTLKENKQTIQVTEQSIAAGPSKDISDADNQNESSGPALLSAAKTASPSVIASTDNLSNSLTAPPPNPDVKGEPVSSGKDTLQNDVVPVIDSLKHPEDKLSEKKNNIYAPAKPLQFFTGIYYSPEWLLNIIGSEKYVTNFGVEESFYIGKYSIRTGLGLSITKGTNELSIEYNQYLGSFKQLDSMAFAWNEPHTDLIPTYYLSDKDVWDSLMKLDNSKIVKRYTYLQVPLILGYDFWNNDQFNIGARIGPILSVLLYTKQLTDNYDPGKNKIILINQISPERIQTNWQIVAGLTLGFGNSRRVGIEFEPEIRYYFNSVYEKSESNEKPWSLGFRIALLIKN